MLDAVVDYLPAPNRSESIEGTDDEVRRLSRQLTTSPFLRWPSKLRPTPLWVHLTSFGVYWRAETGSAITR